MPFVWDNNMGHTATLRVAVDDGRRVSLGSELIEVFTSYDAEIEDIARALGVDAVELERWVATQQQAAAERLRRSSVPAPSPGEAECSVPF